jgi:Polysaccharide lyase
MRRGQRIAWVLIPTSALAAIGLVVGLTASLGAPSEEGAKPSETITGKGWPKVGTARFLDVGTGGSAQLWGSVDCAQPTRVNRRGSGGDPQPRADLRPQGSDGYRRLKVEDGDNFYGERCELGKNDWPSSPVALYHEGEHLFTFASFWLPPQFPLHRRAWQVVMQMKQSQPSNGPGFDTPVLSLHAYRDRWRVYHTGAGYRAPGPTQIWSAPAEAGAWVRFAFDVVYSDDPDVGSLRVYVDLDSDGDVLDPGERSRRFALQTLGREQPGTSTDGLAAGASIPSHLRIGIYHSPTYHCGGNRCSIGIDNVGVYEPRP